MDDQELYAEVQRKLVQSGEWDRILDLLRSKANEASFLDDATHRAKERAGTQEWDGPQFRKIMQGIQADARNNFPLAVRQETLEIIRRAVTDLFES